MLHQEVKTWCYENSPYEPGSGPGTKHSFSFDFSMDNAGLRPKLTQPPLVLMQGKMEGLTVVDYEWDGSEQ